MDIYKMLKKPFFGRFMVKWRNPLTAEQQKEWQPVTTRSRSGGMIHGLFARSKTGHEKATIVLGHPMGKEAKGYFIKNGYTDLLRENGYNTLVFDFNGFGESTHGNFSFFDDIIAIGTRAAALTPDIPIGYHGISLGGQWATIAFADNTHSYDFAIVESAATTLEEFWVNFPFAYRVLKLLYIFLPQYRKKISMIDRIKETKRLKKLLLIYSQSDEWTPVEMGQRFLDNCPVPAELWTVAHASHAQIMKSEHKTDYEKKILDFFQSQVSCPNCACDGGLNEFTIHRNKKKE